MIAKLPSKRRDRRSSFKDLINYCLGVTGHAKNAVLHVGTKNLNSPPEKAYLEMEGVSYENVRCKNPVLHFILSWRAEESPTNEQVDEAVEIALKELDLQGCQALWALQSDTDNLHVHVAVNRVSPENFKAIRSAGGWTKKALERAARKIEIVQGWEVEMTGRYEVDELGNIIERDAIARKSPELSQKARDIEAHTGEESLERQAKREVAKILETATSWEELHEKLAIIGYEFERKGNGAVLKYEDKAVKLSNVSRKSSFSKLERRLGKYQERRKDVIVQQGNSSHQEANETSSETQLRKTSWDEYCAEKTHYLERKKSALKELRERQKEERENLCLVQKRRRTEIFSESWKGRGAELNQVRSILSFASQRERLSLRERQKEEMEELRSHYLRRFPSFRDWLSDQSREDLYRVYRYPGQLLLSPEQSGIRIPALQRIVDLRDYSARRGAGRSVLYCRTGTNTADFSDMGRRIVLNKRKLTEESVASALQLANQKWGATLITGNAEYKELCISAAVKYGLRLANPDLLAEVERRRQALRQAQRPQDGITAEEIASLKLADSPKIYVNPRTDKQQYKGRIVHVDVKRGICVQLVGEHSLFVHRLDSLEVPPLEGDTVKISYIDDKTRARVQRYEERHRTRSL